MANKIKRSTIPISGVKHGTPTGYDKGCGCLDCRRANRERANARADRKVARERAEEEARAAGLAAGNVSLTKFEGNAQAFLDGLGLDSEEAVLLGNLMLMNARLLDNINATGERWHLANATQKSMLEIKGQLKRLKDESQPAQPAPSPGGDKDELGGLLSGLTKQG